MGVDGREFVGEGVADGFGAVEPGAAAGRDLGEDAAGDDVARRHLAGRVDRQHEAFAAIVDEGRAMAAQRLGGKRRGVLADIERGRMELDEFGIGEHAPARAAMPTPVPRASDGLVVTE